MLTSEINKVLTVIQGIAERDPDVTTKYMNPKRYTEHNPLAADGVEGLRDYIRHFPPESHHLKILRVFQDGAYVFTQAEGSILGQTVFFDIFRFEDDQIVEHWVFSAKGGPANVSGHTQADGPTQSNRSEDTARNKAIVRAYYETVHISGDHSVIPRYVSENTIRHEPGVRDGVAAFMRDLEVISQHRTIDEIELLLGQGDFVFIAAKGTNAGGPCVYVDLYRVESGKLDEHWGFPEDVPPVAEWKNTNGML